MTVDTKPHSKCLTCGLEFESEAQSAQHRSDTMGRLDPATGVGKKSHTTTTLNPTAAERDARVVRQAIDDALFEACESLDQAIERGKFTVEQLEAEIAVHPDLDLAWQEWNR